MAADKIRYDLLVEAFLLVDTVEDALELMEELERWLAHEAQHAVGGVLGCHLQSSAHMAGDEFARVLPRRLVGFLVFALMQQEVIAHAAADKALLHARQGIDGMIDIEQLGVVGVEVGADLRMDAGGSFAAFADFQVATLHAIHIGRRATEVGDISLEAFHLGDLPGLFEDALLGPAYHKLALMGRYGAERTSAEASPVHVDRELDHLVGWDGLALVFGVGQTGVGQVERGIHLLGGHGRVGRIGYGILSVYGLEQTAGVHLV